MEKEVAILEEIKEDLLNEQNIEDILKIIKIYKNSFQLINNKKIKKLIIMRDEILEKDGENSINAFKLNKKIDKEIQKIFNK